MSGFKRSKKFKAIILSLLFIVILSVSFGSVLAETINRDNIVIDSGETLEKTSFLSGDTVRIDGNVNATAFVSGSTVEVNGIIEGDLFAAGENVTINGTVNGSLFVAAQSVTVNGVVQNSNYLAGRTLRVNSQTDGSAFLAGQYVTIEEGAVVGKDAFVGSTSTRQDGVVNGDFTSGSESLSIGGKIGGDLNYTSPDRADFSENSEVAGRTNWKRAEPYRSRSVSISAIVIQVLLSILAALVVWFFVRLLRPNFWNSLAEKISALPLKALGFGFLALILTPIVCIILMLTVIGIPLSLIILALYAVSIYVSKIILAVFIGLWVQKRFNWSNAGTFWIFLLALVILSVLGMIPMVGWVLSLVVASFGLGAIVLSIKR